MLFRFLSRRKFIGGVAATGVGFYLGIPPVFAKRNGSTIQVVNEPLLDWTAWEQFRTTVKHPCLTIKTENLNYARENIKLYGWAKDYASITEGRIKRYLHLLTPEFLEAIIEETTPGDPLWTPCPSCTPESCP